MFSDEEVAARAFDKQARVLRGANAHGGRAGPSATRWRINFPTKKEIVRFQPFPPVFKVSHNVISQCLLVGYL